MTDLEYLGFVQLAPDTVGRYDQRAVRNRSDFSLVFHTVRLGNLKCFLFPQFQLCLKFFKRCGGRLRAQRHAKTHQQQGIP